MITYPQIYYICKSIKNTRIYEFFINLQFRGVITPSPRPLRGVWSATLPNRIFWSNSTTWLSPLNFYTLCKSQFQNTWPFSPTMSRLSILCFVARLVTRCQQYYYHESPKSICTNDIAVWYAHSSGTLA